MTRAQTGSPELNELIQTFHSYTEGHSTSDEVLAKFFQFQKVRRSIKNFFSRFTSFEEKRVLALPAVSEVGKLLDELRSVEILLEAALRKQDEKRAGELLAQAIALSEKLLSALGRMKEEEEKRETFSAIPMISEIVRLGKACLAGNFSTAKFGEVIAKSLAYHHSYFAAYRQSGVKTPEIKEKLKEIEACLVGIGERIEKGKKPEEKSLKALATAGDILFEAMKKVESSGENLSRRICLYCGSSNSTGSRYCATCNAILPRMAATEEGGVNLVGDSPYLLTATTEELKKKVEKFLKTRHESESLKSYMEALRTKARRAREQMARLPIPKEVKDSDEKESFQDLKGKMLEDFSRFEEGLSLISEGIVERDPDAVRAALERALAAGSRLAQFQALMG